MTREPDDEPTRQDGGSAQWSTDDAVIGREIQGFISLEASPSQGEALADSAMAWAGKAMESYASYQPQSSQVAKTPVAAGKSTLGSRANKRRRIWAVVCAVTVIGMFIAYMASDSVFVFLAPVGVVLLESLVFVALEIHWWRKAERERRKKDRDDELR